MPSGHRGQLAAACPGPRKMVPFWTFFEAFWSSLKHFEAVWNSLNSRSRNSLKQSEADWSQAQYYMAQLRSLTTQGLHFSLLGINLLNLSHRHSTNHTLELLRGQKQDLQIPKKNMLTTSCNSPLSKSWGQLNFNKESSNQIWFKPYESHIKPYKTLHNLTPKSMAFTQLVLKTRKIDCIRIYQIVLVTPGTHMKHNCRTLALRISLKADAKRPSRAACSSVSRASQNGALLNILWSILKQFEALWSSLKQFEQ